VTNHGRPAACPPRRWPAALALAALLAAALALRAADLKADPPAGLSWSVAPYTDESADAYSARNMLLYGTWRVDDFCTFAFYPLANVLVFLVLKLFGLGFVQLKLVSLLCGAATVYLVYRLMRPDHGEVGGFTVALLTTTSFPLVMYSRVGLIETPAILFLVLTGFCLVQGLGQAGRSAKVWMAAAGACCSATFLFVKLSAIFVLPASVAVLLLELGPGGLGRTAPRAFLARVACWLAGALVVAAVWLAVVFLPYRADFLRGVLGVAAGARMGRPGDVVALLAHTLSFGIRTGLLARLPVVALLGFLFLPTARGSRAVRFCAFWFLFGLLTLGTDYYRPTRYELLLVVPLIAGFAAFIAHMVGAPRTAGDTGTTKPAVWRVVGYGLWLTAAFANFGLLGRYPAGQFRPKAGLPLLLAALAAAAVATVLWYRVGRRMVRALRRSSSIGWRVGAALALVAVSVGFDAVQFARWLRTRSYQMYEYSRDMAALLPDGAVVAGNWAPALMVGSRERVVYFAEWMDPNGFLERHRATYLVLTDNREDVRIFRRTYPGLIESSLLLRRYAVRGANLTLGVYALPLARAVR
jgi:4-amino-4-deoxy-L-arabinose transferase-like glycosyltransferase